MTVDATATAGPSHVGGMTCSPDGGQAKQYTTAGVTVNGDGTHTVSCIASNNAVDPQGRPNTGTNTIAIHIDEAPPTLTFEPRNPGDPTGLVVTASDSESGVASGSIEMAPAGTSNWTSLPTTFDGSHLLAHFDDADRNGTYTFRASACDNVGNCTSSSEAMALPVRAASDAAVSLTKIVNPLQRRTVQEQVRVDWHWATVRRDGKTVKVKRGGHLKTIKVVKYVEQCTTRRSRTGHAKRVCTKPTVHTTKTLDVPYGKPVTVHGLYTTSTGVPIGGQPVHILAAANNGLAPFSPVAVVTTAADGGWTATLPAGPSRLIRGGHRRDRNDPAVERAGNHDRAGQDPAGEGLARRVAWGGTVHLVGQLLGGYLPPDGALVRLRIGYGSTYNTYGVEEHVTGNGRFSTVASFGPGDPSVYRTYWFQIASLPMGNYPYAPAASQRVTVIVGGQPTRRLVRTNLHLHRPAPHVAGAEVGGDRGVDRPSLRALPDPERHAPVMPNGSASTPARENCSARSGLPWIRPTTLYVKLRLAIAPGADRDAFGRRPIVACRRMARPTSAGRSGSRRTRAAAVRTRRASSSSPSAASWAEAPSWAKAPGGAEAPGGKRAIGRAGAEREPGPAAAPAATSSTAIAPRNALIIWLHGAIRVRNNQKSPSPARSRG